MHRNENLSFVWLTTVSILTPLWITPLDATACDLLVDGIETTNCQENAHQFVQLFCAEKDYPKTCSAKLINHSQIIAHDSGTEDKNYLLLLHSAARLGNPKAEFLLGQHYRFSENTKDTLLAIKLFESTAASGHVLAAFEAANLYHYGPELIQNPQKSFRMV